MSADRVAAAALAEQIGGACTEAMLDWGQAVNRAKDKPDDKALELLAKAYGSRALELAMGLARKLRPQ